MAIYLKYGALEGDVTMAGYEKWIEVQSFSWGVGRGITSPQVGGSADREGSSPSVSEITLTHTQDITSNNLLRESLWGEGKDVEIHFCKTNKDGCEPYYKFKLTNTMISGYSTSSGGDRPQESFSLNFTKFEFHDLSMDNLNAPGEQDIVHYDLATGKGS